MKGVFVKTLVSGLGALLLVIGAASVASAQFYPPSLPPSPYAPWSYCPGGSGMYSNAFCGPNLPPAPFGGVGPPAFLPLKNCCPASCGPQFGINPYLRSPRDYFMLDLNRSPTGF
jgi:hypothetical protein